MSAEKDELCANLGCAGSRSQVLFPNPDVLPLPHLENSSIKDWQGKPNVLDGFGPVFHPAGEECDTPLLYQAARLTLARRQFCIHQQIEDIRWLAQPVVGNAGRQPAFGELLDKSRLGL